MKASKKLSKKATAYHEAGHFVMALIGHDQPGGVAAYSTPHTLSIKSKKGSLGRVVDPHLSFTGHFQSADLIKEIIGLLAGYTAQSIAMDEAIHGIEFALGSKDETHDFYKANQLLNRIKSSSELSIRNIDPFAFLLEHTRSLLSDRVIWSAIDLVAQQLLVKGEIDRSTGLFDLIDEVDNMPGFSNILVPIPQSFI